MEVKPGYKQSEVGVIPEQWEVDAIGDAFNISGGFSASWDQLGSNGHCYLHYGDIHTSTKSFINVHSKRLDIPRLNVPLSRIPAKSLLDDGDVVFVDASEDDEGTSKHLVVVNPEGIPYISGLHTIVAKSKTALFDNTYKRYCFQTRDIQRQFLFYAVGTKVTGISKTNIKKVFIPRPPIPEQRAIAEALSDVDALIGALDHFIAKKHDLKQAAIQQLLTGQSRLPGFQDKWDVKRIGEFTECTSGGTPSTLVPSYWGGSIKWMSSGELNLKRVSEVEGRISEEGLANSCAKMIPKNCVLVGLAGQGKTRGTVAMNLVELCTNQSIAAILPSPAFVPQYLYYNLDARYDELRGLSSGDGGRGGLNLTIIKSIPVPFPKTAEQAAIAEVLSDMDAELAALENRREKTRALKRGMMQVLLTGRTRLI